ncbi:uncharacterized protein [Henckelia pumila]|uniref:uncharacterized protein n=1 Tax=Henckelia pumila TaxID=405737 RepID=UPI003C6E1E98
MSHVSTDGNPSPPVKVVEYLESSMSNELLCKFPDNSAFDFDYSQSSIWSPLVPRTFGNGRGGSLELSRKLQYDENDFTGLLRNSKKFAANIKKKFTSVVSDNICMYQRMKMSKRKSFGFSPVPSSGRLKASSPTPRKKWAKAMKAASKHFKKNKKKDPIHLHLQDVSNYLPDCNL